MELQRDMPTCPLTISAKFGEAIYAISGKSNSITNHGDGSFTTVSYTHLTLPTKRIV